MINFVKSNLKSLINYLLDDYWTLAFIDNMLFDIINDKPLIYKFVKNPYYKDRWFADPFILDVDDNNIFLLVEDFFYSDRKGRISELTIDRHSYQIVDVHIILELDSHLSFPAIFRDKGHVYIYPENSKAGGLWLYEYNPQTDECKMIEKLSDQPFTDAIVTNLFGKKQIFSTKEPNPNKNVLDVYDWDEEKKSFEQSESITFEENIARNAGDVFWCGNSVFRPAQECNAIYGHSVSIQQIEYRNRIISFKEVRRITPTCKKYIGQHTINSFNNCVVTDFRGFRRPLIARIIMKLMYLFRKV